jgi:hypothetical protein
MSPTRAALLDRIMEHHDYVWARLPFVPPMAIAVARRRRDPSSDELVGLVTTLQKLLLDHLAREEATMVWGGQPMHADHVSIAMMLDRIHAIAERCQWNELDRAFCNELARLHEHVTCQIGLEEAL